MPAVHDPRDLGAAIRAARRAEGWTQAELARRADVGRQWLNAVEQGHPRAELGLVQRVLAALGMALDTSLVPAPERSIPWLTARDAAGAIRDELATGDLDFAFRLLARAVGDFRDLRATADVQRFLLPPPSTGDHRWDALLATVVSRECRLRDIVAPTWTKVPALRSWWFPDDDPLLMARTMQRTPIDLQVKGIWLDAKALETL